LSDISLDKLLNNFLKKGGTVDKYYLRETNRSKRALVHLNGWFSGQNVRTAILKAFGKIQ
jgi:hypothetical protein